MLHASFVIRLSEFSSKGIVLFAIGGGLALICNIVVLLMIRSINRTLPDNQRVSYLLWGTGVIKQYGRRYPSGRLKYLLRTCTIFLVAWFVFVALLMLGVLKVGS